MKNSNTASILKLAIFVILASSANSAAEVSSKSAAKSALKACIDLQIDEEHGKSTVDVLTACDFELNAFMSLLDMEQANSMLKALRGYVEARLDQKA